MSQWPALQMGLTVRACVGFVTISFSELTKTTQLDLSTSLASTEYKKPGMYRPSTIPRIFTSRQCQYQWREGGPQQMPPDLRSCLQRRGIRTRRSGSSHIYRYASGTDRTIRNLSVLHLLHHPSICIDLHQAHYCSTADCLRYSLQQRFLPLPPDIGHKLCPTTTTSSCSTS